MGQHTTVLERIDGSKIRAARIRDQQQKQQDSSVSNFPATTAPLLLLSSSHTTNFMFRYTSFLCMLLGLWVLYLILPRGFRFQYCRASRRRHQKQTTHTTTVRRQNNQQEWLKREYYNRQRDARQEEDWRKPTKSTLSSYRDPASSFESKSFDTTSTRMSSVMGTSFYRGRDDKYGGGGDETTTTTGTSWQARSKSADEPSSAATWSTRTPTMDSPSATTSVQNTTGSSSLWLRSSPRRMSPKPPSETIVMETMQRLKLRGIRLLAHGVQCEPKRVWIRIEEETTSLVWQTEFPRRIPNASGETSLVLMRGSLHKIALPNILYIDVGKKTNALAKNASVSDSLCFSLLTQNGSLDLQTNSTLERDALVVCFGRVLDAIHTDVDWRSLYEESPAPSSRVASTSSSSAAAVSSSAVTNSGVDPYPSDVVMI